MTPSECTRPYLVPPSGEIEDVISVEGPSDVTGGNTSTYETALAVPRFEEDKLSASSLILADLMERVPMKTIGAGDDREMAAAQEFRAGIVYFANEGNGPKPGADDSALGGVYRH